MVAGAIAGDAADVLRAIGTNHLSIDLDHRPQYSDFSHVALFYDNDHEYLDGTVPFIEKGLSAGEAVLVAVPAARLEVIRPQFEPAETDLLSFVPMEEIGRNPACIIPAWVDFVDACTAAGRSARAIGEPVWSGRSEDELVECGFHETLLNIAFADVAGFELMCPYHITALDRWVIDEAERNHPHVSRTGVTTTSASFDEQIPTCLDRPLSPVPKDAETIVFDREPLRQVRLRAGQVAAAAGLSPSKVEDVVLAVSEATTNSIRHGGGRGRIALWSEGSRFLCEIRDHGRISDPLAGRIRPTAEQPGGRGLWLMNQQCDLVQIRRLPDGQAIRLQFVT